MAVEFRPISSCVGSMVTYDAGKLFELPVCVRRAAKWSSRVIPMKQTNPVRGATAQRRGGAGRPSKRGRPAAEDWHLRARYILRHLDDPIALQASPLCRLAALDRLARSRYPHSIVPDGRALHDVALGCLQEIESELEGHTGVARLRDFVRLTRGGMGVTEASRNLGITPEYASRALKRRLVELLAEKLLAKLR